MSSSKKFVKITFPSYFCIPFESGCDLLTLGPQDLSAGSPRIRQLVPPDSQAQVPQAQDPKQKIPSERSQAKEPKPKLPS